jgi:lipopolysaccharide/colanic/teichoic acid biosynthesis glycosyltransferase
MRLAWKRDAVKRTFDIIGSLIGLLLLLPFAIVVTIAIRCGSKGPVFYLQNRVGRGGKVFRIVKFRTMRMDADREGSITTSTDLRVTRIGRLLRRYKLDEYPQLWNVLRGKMSFVGPRPDVQGYADRLEGDEREILALLPGITGPASLFFRNEEQLLANAPDAQKYNDEVIWPTKVHLNLIYARTWSFWRDIGYILVTVIPWLNRWFKLVPKMGGPVDGCR